MSDYVEYIGEQLTTITDFKIETSVKEDETGQVKEFKLDGPDFKDINVRKEENAAVEEYQKTKDPKILEGIYVNRIPSLNYWARKNQHLDNNSFGDIKGELTTAFLKAIKGYSSNLGVEGKVYRHFNTYLYSSFTHGMCNIYNKKKAKKRTPLNSENESLYEMLLSLDYVYGNGDGSSFTLKDVVADPSTGDNGGVVNPIMVDEMLDVLSDGVPCTKEFLRKLSYGQTIPSLLREYKRVDARMRVKREVAERISASRRPCTKIVTDLIKAKVPERFKLLEYNVKGCFIYYSIELHKTDKTDVIMRKIRKLKKNKEFYLDKIRTS
jgi:hypothetical protein